LYETATETQRGRIAAFDDGNVGLVRLTADATRALASHDQSPVIALLDMTTLSVAARYHHHTAAITDLRWLESIDMFASVAEDCTLKTWQARTALVVDQSPPARLRQPVTNLTSADSAMSTRAAVYTTTTNVVLLINEPVALPLPCATTLDLAAVVGCGMSPDGAWAGVWTDAAFCVWNSQTHAAVLLATVDTALTAMAVGSVHAIATGHADGSVRLWDGHESVTWQPYTTPVSICELSDDHSQLLLLAQGEQHCSLWGTEDQSQQGRFVLPDLITATLSNNGKVVAATTKRSLCVWDTDSGAILCQLERCGDLHAIRLSVLGTLVAVIATPTSIVSRREPPEVQLWSLIDGHLLHTILMGGAIPSAIVGRPQLYVEVDTLHVSRLLLGYATVDGVVQRTVRLDLTQAKSQAQRQRYPCKSVEMDEALLSCLATL
jgi:WD40 repeat protein